MATRKCCRVYKPFTDHLVLAQIHLKFAVRGPPLNVANIKQMSMKWLFFTKIRRKISFDLSFLAKCLPVATATE